ncbi:phosphoglycerate mutase (2,3-diphosphoglycerate-independent) [Candidatus Amesbacteria bacterium RIFOXYB1_FULL_44_23]|uniref:2,3-bisphosphoglycerate-independent phosphoglycerate mutase n=1 Tax=Candidatus Amesbacteria bacterium RIFOXYB1_FULL_44_23 TaxID=1797263 RepID=A0A1F4ZSE9_9BACT|nr:MAG: phosphoglycerate mutase (2,3-diphosphoglycerate-independent) [Candidatus Amesbacteria bacterium RIFOXYB1_FULL_44_23]
MFTRPKPVLLTIMDGWGMAPDGPGNAITQAKTPNIDYLWQNFLHTQLIAHGESVGLPKREPGNTETGHLNMGAGSIVYQDLPRINMSIADGSFFQNPALLKAAAHVKTNNSRFHIMGLIGGGGVHSDISHFFALLRFCHEQQLTEVYLHLFTDGRDSPPTVSMTYVNQLQTVMAREGVGQIASVAGRYYAMDRDFRWDRIQKTYLALAEGKGPTAPNIETAISTSYAAGKMDEFIEPTVILNSDGQPQPRVQKNDAAVFVNFRIDRPRELTKAFVLPDFEKTANVVGFDPYAVDYLKKHDIEDSQISKQKPFARGPRIENLFFVTLTEYETNLPVTIAYPPQAVEKPLGFIIAEQGLTQLRVAESEKERFVTYYFNGLKEEPFPKEERMIIPSPKVPTYDKKPEMSAHETTAKLVEAIASGKYDQIVINYANPDMVAHTGNLQAAIKAVETTDECIGQVYKAILEAGGVMLITADHGNAEEMINFTTGEVDTEHNANPVPLIIVGKDFQTGAQIAQGILADVAPTILSIMQIPLPLSMNGRNLISSVNQ